ncbi:hypothetical protein CSC94_23630 [Zhengella mangrovi]|uniref:MAPEG family protein n=1 Tax=Zhengella mangrovi TaxID=1982044 RepID=A0A2G1QGJ6_9HYPH|nr:MAPEG family protein [Zhengella mangrovi]PHP64574.1 hypothetical protein CSC94_23630 [Zhengella mangrovi]
MGNRDHQPEPGIIAGRLERAKDNMREALPLFLGLAMLAFAAGKADEATSGAIVFATARVFYVPAYTSGLPVLRSLVWLAGMAGLLMTALAVL